MAAFSLPSSVSAVDRACLEGKEDSSFEGDSAKAPEAVWIDVRHALACRWFSTNWSLSDTQAARYALPPQLAPG